ncbi:MAG: RadC family protein [Alphaproteobacteria bacterium]|nr:RadC family protein [Alphaproteobacteria bacterium]
MATLDSQFRNGHRERLRQKFLDNKLAEYEKLELMLGYVVPRRDMRPLAHAMLEHFGSLSNILTARYDDLIEFPGIGRNVAIFIKLIHDIILTGYRNELIERPIFHSDKELRNYCMWMLASKNVEEFHVFYMDDDLRLLQDQVHSVGTVDCSSIYTREIVKRALELNATNILLVHNHPNDIGNFSTPDMAATEELYNALQPLGINVRDHLLVTKNKVSSAKDLTLFHF